MVIDFFIGRDNYQLGSLSHFINNRAPGYQDLPPFPEVAPDPSTRDVADPSPVRSITGNEFELGSYLSSPSYNEGTQKKKAASKKKKSFYSSSEESEENSDSGSGSGSSSNSSSGTEDSESDSIEENNGGGQGEIPEKVPAVSSNSAPRKKIVHYDKHPTDESSNGSGSGSSDDESSESSNESSSDVSDEKPTIKSSKTTNSTRPKSNVDLLLDLGGDDEVTCSSNNATQQIDTILTAMPANISSSAKGPDLRNRSKDLDFQVRNKFCEKVVSH